jgi:23S rRNA pseudouridine955/2504/2580 synthase
MSPKEQGHQVRHVCVSDDRDGQRLDNFLLGHLPGVPRSLIYRLVRTGQVRVNGGRCKPMRKLKAGDDVRIPPVVSEAPGSAKIPASLVDNIKSRIVHQDDDFIVIDKPSGLAVHGGSGLSFGLMDAMSQWSADIRPVHRLDRATSGLLMLACSHQAAVRLQRLFAQRRVEKRYLALLSGELKDDVATVDLPLKKIRDQSGQHRVIAADDGQPARSHFRVLERLRGYTYVEADIETGRTHQIRAHAAAIGHPLAGDDRYNPGAAPTGLKRLFLHAHFLRLPWSEELVFNVSLPEDLKSVLSDLRRPEPQD